MLYYVIETGLSSFFFELIKSKGIEHKMQEKIITCCDKMCGVGAIVNSHCTRIPCHSLWQSKQDSKWKT